MRKTRSGASFSPYVEHPSASSHQLVHIAAESETFFLEAAERERMGHCAADVEQSSSSFQPTCDSESLADPERPAHREVGDLHPEIVGAVRPAMPSSSTPGPRLLSDKRKMGKQRRRSEKRRAAALERDAAPSTMGRPVKPSTIRKHRKFDKVAGLLSLDTQPHAAGGSWIGLRDGGGAKGATTATSTARWKKEVPTLEDLMSTGLFQYVPYHPGKNLFFVDDEGRIVASLLDRPPGADWDETCAEAARCLEAAEEIGAKLDVFGEADMHTRRGDFLQVPIGPSMGGGQQQPTNLYSSNSRRHRINQSILQNLSIQRIAGVQSSAFAFTSPKLYGHYCQELGPVFKQDPLLLRNFPNSVYPAASFNCSAESTSLAHFDFNNLSFGQCSLTPLGSFDHRLGGHIVLYSVGKIVEFPCGTTFTLPSAAYEHGNTRIPPGQSRRSIAQYAAGALFRWKAYGYRTAQTLSKTAVGRAQLQAANQGPNERWNNGLDLYSTVDSLASDYSTLQQQLSSL